MTSPNPKPKHPWIFDTETPITPDEFDQIGDLGNEVDDTINDQKQKQEVNQQEEKRHEGSQHNEGQ